MISRLQRQTGELADEVLFALQKAVARKQAAPSRGRGALGADDLRARARRAAPARRSPPRTSASLSPSRAARRRRRPRPPVRRRRPCARAPPDRTIYDLATSGGSLDAEKLEAYLVDARVRGTRPAGADGGPTRPSGSRSSSSARSMPMLRANHDYVIVDTPPGFTPEVIATIDSSSRHLHGRDARLAVAQEHEARARDARADGLRPRAASRCVLNRADSRVGISHDDVRGDRRPRRRTCWSRAIARSPRSVNDGSSDRRSAKPRSEAARAFQALAGALRPADEPSRGAARAKRRAGG